MKYVYPAIFTQEEEGISVHFPSFESCYTSGETVLEAIEMAKDVLCLTLYDMEENQKAAPQPMSIKALVAAENEFVSYIECDTLEYRKFYESKAVKKTLTIPSWLNAMAEREGVNFSSVLQNALKEQLRIS